MLKLSKSGCVDGKVSVNLAVRMVKFSKSGFEDGKVW